jgi:hypothetical protein
MEINFAHKHNPTLFGSLSVSPPVSMLDSFSPLLHFNDDFSDVLNQTATTTIEDDIDDWMKPLLLDQLFEHDFLSPEFSNDDIEIKQETPETRKFSTMNNNCSFIIDEKLLSNNYSYQQTTRENEFIDLFHQHHSSEQQLPTTTTTVRLIHQPKIEPAELPTTLYVSGNELQFHPIVTTNKTIGHTYTTTRSSPLPSVPLQSSVPIVPARVLKGKKFKRGGRVSSRATSRSNAAAKRRLNSTAAEPKASVVIIAEDATRIDSKTTTLGLSSTGSCASDTDLLKSSSSTTSTRSSTRRRIKSTPREVILFRNGAFISKEPISKQQSTTTLCFETTTTTTSTTNNCPPPPPPLHQQQITATGLQAAAQIVACNVLRQATLNDALIEQLIKREPTNTDDDYPIYCYSSPSLSSSCTMTAALDEYENSCSTTLKILGCNTTAPLHSTTSNNTTTTIELLTFAALQQQQQQHQPQFCYIKQEPGTTTTTTFLLPRLLPQ